MNDEREGKGNEPHRRRPRYKGTHPRRYEEKYNWIPRDMQTR